VTGRASAPTGADLGTARVGFVGAGQLARMTQRAAIDLAVHLEVQAAHADDPAVLAGASYRLGAADDLDALFALAQDVDVVTLDHELVPNEHLRALQHAGHRVHPSPDAVRFAQDKLYARSELQRLGFPVPPFAQVAHVDDVVGFGERHGWPVVLKARRGGYDGRGVRVLERAGDVGAELPAGEWLAEAHVAIAVELAVLVARRPSGQRVVYPVVETVQQQGICRELVMPARVAPDVASSAVTVAEDIVEAIGGVGIVAVELFVADDGRLLVNELALRPHNSGHATIEGSATSQFHNHLRAVLDWPLGDVSMRAPVAAMVNVLGGSGTDPLAQRLPHALTVAGAQVHLYGKQPRPGRKIGHVTALADRVEDALASARSAAGVLQGG
jgi:5-(carboxyamino)imidazole ribonucleotide synthase